MMVVMDAVDDLDFILNRFAEQMGDTRMLFSKKGSQVSVKKSTKLDIYTTFAAIYSHAIVI